MKDIIREIVMVIGIVAIVAFAGALYTTPIELNLGYWWTLVLQFPLASLALLGLIKIIK